MTSSLSGKDEPNLALLLATQAGKMELSCPLRIRVGFGVSSHVINPLLTKLVWSR